MVLTSAAYPKAVEITGIAIEQKVNGTVITIEKRGKTEREQVSAWTSETGWFYMTLVDASIDTTREWPFVRTGFVTEFQAHQMPESVQLNFRLSKPVESYEIVVPDAQGDIVTVLRLPLSETYGAIDKLKSVAGDEVSVGGTESVSSLKERAPYLLMVAGAGMVAGGLLRSEAVEFIVGTVFLAGGYLYIKSGKPESPE
tara:strand:+ start:508 stop:1104 length:597 start_codon:yes stop_codon:yes gene_type:complete